ncbi:hypothetical protein OIU84_006751 [Salix udensis]|uniref:Photosystem II reaction center PsbP family protein n=1 Tax=Salix udensis TaxID=889485 RepID=A0AAD6JZE4_9ROSI|nr:hypothetical protein OIU84_006751 [Salix udensis]
MALLHHFLACKNGSIQKIYMTRSSGDRKESLQEVPRPPAEQFAPLSSRFQRRLLVGAGSASLVAVGANFGGITSFLLGFWPESGRNVKLDVLYPIGGYSRCIETNEGFEFIYPATWVGDQRLLYRAAEKTEYERSLDPPPLSNGKSGDRRRRKNVNEPVVAFGPRVQAVNSMLASLYHRSLLTFRLKHSEGLRRWEKLWFGQSQDHAST